ncbi:MULTISPECIES: SUMF1/EgtB/PvdO family nonheme iron enzyme [Leptolyngbya]|uniref:SUMF1/EgtB/PvdO family nonheme iron enzyme n=1 Tax=Leptolyngbya TaxID=47251 RepID=UPI0032204504
MERGGSWINNPRNCRSATRNNNDAGTRNNNNGFRVVCSAPSTLQFQNGLILKINPACFEESRPIPAMP